MTAKVVLVQEAERQLLQIDEWWIENRRSAPNLFLDEFSKALELIAEMPKIGQLFRKANQPGVRRLLLRRSNNWIYYVHDPEKAMVYVLAIWSTFRGSDPAFSKLKIE